MRRSGISLKLAIVYLIIAIPLIVLIFTIYSSWYQARTERTLLQLDEIARSTDTSFTLFVDGIDKSMGLVGVNIVNNKLSPQETSSTLSGLLAIYPIDNAVFTDSSGTIVTATDSRLVGQSLAKHPAFSAIITGNKSEGIEPVERVVSPVGFHVAQAIRDSSGILQGIVSCYVDITRLGSALPIRTTTGATNIVDSNGTLVFQSEFQKLVLTNPFWGKYDFVKTALSGKDAVSTKFVFPVTGKVRIIAEVPISEFGWAAGSSIDADQVLSPIRRDIINSALVAAAILIIALIISILIVRRVISSLSYLAERARAVGEGHFDEPILIATGDEIEDVAHSLDEARLNLKQAVESLSESNKKVQLLLQSMDEGIYGVDTKEHCTFINRAASEMLGYKPEEILGKNAHELMHYKHSDGSPYTEDECPI
ncbi:MAG: cache domain-containing protein, partial [Candidatus Aquicultor sp.]